MGFFGAYLLDTPRSYFGDDTASAPSDVDREAGALADWWAGYHGVTDRATIAEQRAALAGILAADHDSEAEDDEIDISEEDLFVERKAARFLRLPGLSRPTDLPDE
ncbi:hypothetical protein AB0H43_32615 [Hamadaea sp. NPDC050747]|uniref:hypothetical protein n=1 Tax=Hamadaea sp. NPDC050747 TaxID=3155789 RepID=UPI0033E61D3B